MSRAGWHPQGMIDMFNKLNELSGHHQMDFFEMLAATHPATDDRIIATREYIAAQGNSLAGLKMDSPRFQQLKKKLPPKKETEKPAP